jgi:hypothetical protein
MTAEKIQKERERIKKIYVEMLDTLIAKRQLMVKKRSKHTISISEIKRLQDWFFWYIDKPHYGRKEKL